MYNFIKLNHIEKLKQLCNKYLTPGMHCWAAAILLVFFHNNPFSVEKFKILKNELLSISDGFLPTLPKNPLPQYVIMNKYDFYSVPINKAPNNLSKTKSEKDTPQFTTSCINKLLEHGPILLTIKTEEEKVFHDVVLHGIQQHNNHDPYVFISHFDNSGTKQDIMPLYQLNQLFTNHKPNTQQLKSTKLNYRMKTTMHSAVWAKRSSKTNNPN